MMPLASRSIKRVPVGGVARTVVIARRWAIEALTIEAIALTLLERCCQKMRMKRAQGILRSSVYLSGYVSVLYLRQASLRPLITILW